MHSRYSRTRGFCASWSVMASCVMNFPRAAEVTPLSGRVFFAGARSSEDIPVWMNACDLLVLPSLSEGRPNVVLEAQACGLPVIATRVGGTPELIEDGVDGILVEAGDSCALAESIKQLCDEEGLKNELGAAARRKVEESGLTWEQTASRTQSVYERAAGRQLKPCVESPEKSCARRVRE